MEIHAATAFMFTVHKYKLIARYYSSQTISGTFFYMPVTVNFTLVYTFSVIDEKTVRVISLWCVHVIGGIKFYAHRLSTWTTLGIVWRKTLFRLEFMSDFCVFSLDNKSACTDLFVKFLLIRKILFQNLRRIIKWI